MSDMRAYRRVAALLQRCKNHGIDTQFTDGGGAQLVLFRDQGAARVLRFDDADGLESFLRGYETALERGREHGSKF